MKTELNGHYALVFELATVFILPAIVGINGIWSSVCVAEILAFIMTCSLILGFRRRYLGESIASK